MSRLITNTKHKAFSVVQAALKIIDAIGEPDDDFPEFCGRRAKVGRTKLLVWGAGVTVLKEIEASCDRAAADRVRHVYMSNIAIEIWANGGAKSANLHPVGPAIECVSWHPGPWVDELIAAAQRLGVAALGAPTVH